MWGAAGSSGHRRRPCWRNGADGEHPCVIPKTMQQMLKSTAHSLLPSPIPNQSPLPPPPPPQLVMAPSTLLVTASNAAHVSTWEVLQDVIKREGPLGLYRGGGAVLLRQLSNWASRQGITDAVRSQFLKAQPPGATGMGMGSEIACGIIGGVLSCWNTPFEVARIHGQKGAHGHSGEACDSVWTTLSSIAQEEGPGGLFRGLPARSASSPSHEALVCLSRL